MAATERVVVLMTAEEKHNLEARAKKAGLKSTAAFIREKVSRDDEVLDPMTQEALEAFRDVLFETIDVMNRSLDEIQTTLDQTIAAYEQRHGIKL